MLYLLPACRKRSYFIVILSVYLAQSTSLVKRPSPESRHPEPVEGVLISRGRSSHSFCLRFTLHRRLLSPADLGGPSVFFEEVEHGLVDKPITCDQFLPINRV